MLIIRASVGILGGTHGMIGNPQIVPAVFTDPVEGGNFCRQGAVPFPCCEAAQGFLLGRGGEQPVAVPQFPGRVVHDVPSHDQDRFPGQFGKVARHGGTGANDNGIVDRRVRRGKLELLIPFR